MLRTKRDSIKMIRNGLDRRQLHILSNGFVIDDRTPEEREKRNNLFLTIMEIMIVTTALIILTSNNL